MTVDYCPIEIMVADLYTKLIQGNLFRLLQNKILNLNNEDV